MPDEQYAALRTGEARRLAEHIPGPYRLNYRGRARGDKWRLMTDQQGLVSLEIELEIALVMEEEATL